MENKEKYKNYMREIERKENIQTQNTRCTRQKYKIQMTNIKIHKTNTKTKWKIQRNHTECKIKDSKKTKKQKQEKNKNNT